MKIFARWDRDKSHLAMANLHSFTQLEFGRDCATASVMVVDYTGTF